MQEILKPVTGGGESMEIYDPSMPSYKVHVMKENYAWANTCRIHKSHGDIFKRSTRAPFAR